MPSRLSRSHAAAGVTCLIGSVALVAAAFLPWIRLDAFPVASFIIRGWFNYDPSMGSDVGGLAQGGDVLLLPAGIVAVLSLLLAVSRGAGGYFLRLPLLSVGAVALAGGLYLMANPDTVLGEIDTGSNVGDRLAGLVRDQVVSARPAEGLFALIGAGALLSVGSVLPTTRRQPIAGYAYDSQQQRAPAVATPDPATWHELEPRRGSHRAAVGLVLTLAVVGLGVFVAGLREDGSSAQFGALGIRSDTADREDEVRCMQGIIREIGTMREAADNAWRLDSAQAVVNSDGNSAYAGYAGELARLDPSLCPSGFKGAHSDLVDAWSALGAYLTEATKPHAPWNDDWSDEAVAEQRARLEVTVNQAENALRAQVNGS